MGLRSVGMMAWLVAWSGSAAEPYQVDMHTLHLWHLNASRPPFADLGTNPSPLLGLLNGAQPRRPAWPGFGNSVSFHHNAGGTPGTADLRGAILLGAANLDAGGADNMPPTFRFAGEDGAFTYEALVNLDVMPDEAEVIALGIISMDGDEGARVFNFRIEKEGFLAFIPLSRLRSAGGALATIPVSGPDAVTTGAWFHVAVTYNGNENTSNNLRLYWTRVRPGLTRANRIGQGSMPTDLPRTTGDFAIGNEARGFPGNAESEPFPGRIDEVRISSVARDPSDYCFVPSESRRLSGDAETEAVDGGPSRIGLRLENILVNGEPVPGPVDRSALALEPGPHRLDFDFAILPDEFERPARIRHQLDGLDDDWRESRQGMVFLVEILDRTGAVLTTATFPAAGSSPGWGTNLDDSRFSQRSEALYVPRGATSVRLQFSSGVPDTTGVFAIDDLDVLRPQPDGGFESMWFNPTFAETENPGTPGGRPVGWERGGGDPSIARLTIETADPALALVDADQTAAGSWIAEAALPPDLPPESTVLLEWKEAYNVIGGKMHRASYVNVPSGRYVFRAVAVAGDGRREPAGSLAVPVTIRPPIWQRPWFWPVMAASAVALAAASVVVLLRRRGRRRERELQLEKALADDRARIARDMHDDLGTRITLLTMNSALIDRDLTRDPDKARAHLSRMNSAARNLVTAMDDLVWAVDPANDTLDSLGTFIARTAEEIFQGSAVRCRLEIPLVLPKHPIGSDFRHHLALAVKECLHNILRHAGPCEVRISLQWDGRELTITIADSGRGFDPTDPASGNGLSNMAKRLEQLHGACRIVSAPGKGTTITMTCPLPTVSHHD